MMKRSSKEMESYPENQTTIPVLSSRMRYNLNMELVLTIDPDLYTESIPDPGKSQSTLRMQSLDGFIKTTL